MSLNTEIASITANIDTLKAELKEKKSALKKAEKEVASLEAKKTKFTVPDLFTQEIVKILLMAFSGLAHCVINEIC